MHPGSWLSPPGLRESRGSRHRLLNVAWVLYCLTAGFWSRAEQRRARVEQLCVGVEQRWQGLRSVTPSPHAAGAQRLTQLRAGPRVSQR